MVSLHVAESDGLKGQNRMSMFTICTAFVAEGKLNIIWAITEWKSEKHHNDAAQSLMKKRRDDRIASILSGPDPYFEIFCQEEKALTAGEFSDKLRFLVVAHGLVNTKARERFKNLLQKRIAETAGRLHWLRIYHNTYNPDEFVAFLGFAEEEAFNQVRNVGDFLLEEYLFTGIRKPFGMSYLAGYNQFICVPLSLLGDG